VSRAAAIGARREHLNAAELRSSTAVHVSHEVHEELAYRCADLAVDGLAVGDERGPRSRDEQPTVKKVRTQCSEYGGKQTRTDGSTVLFVLRERWKRLLRTVTHVSGPYKVSGSRHRLHDVPDT